MRDILRLLPYPFSDHRLERRRSIASLQFRHQRSKDNQGSVKGKISLLPDVVHPIYAQAEIGIYVSRTIFIQFRSSRCAPLAKVTFGSRQEFSNLNHTSFCS